MKNIFYKFIFVLLCINTSLYAETLGNDAQSIISNENIASWAYYRSKVNERWYISPILSNLKNYPIYSLMAMKNNNAGWGTVSNNGAVIDLVNNTITIKNISDNSSGYYYDAGWDEYTTNMLIQQDIEWIRSSTVNIDWWFFQASNGYWYIVNQSGSVHKFASKDGEYDWKLIDMGTYKPIFSNINGNKIVNFENKSTEIIDIDSPVLTSIFPLEILVGTQNITLNIYGKNLEDVTKVYIAGVEQSITYISSVQITLYVTQIHGGDLNQGVPYGLRDVEVKFYDGSKKILSKGFNAKEIDKANLESDAYKSQNTLWIYGYAPKRFYDYSKGEFTVNGDAKGNCTWYAQGRAIELGYNKTIANKFTLNASEWDTIARNNNISMNNTPQVGSIAQRNGGNLGHVAIVEEILTNNQIRISESSYCPGCIYDDYEYKEEVVNISSFDNYIHLSK